MSKKKMAFVQSLIALILCASMFVGTTFAWFTDSVQTGINTIAAGTLDVEMYRSNAAVDDERVISTTELFKDMYGKDILWEPGVVSYENLRIANEGDLALAYQLSINTANENFVVDGEDQYGLSQILQVGVVEGGITATDRAGVLASVEDADWTTLADFLRSGKLLPEGDGEFEKTWGIVIYWEPGENDNYWNLNNDKKLNEGEYLMIELGVKLVATQEVHEFDSIDNEYDSNAKADFYDGFQGGFAGATVTSDDQGLTTAEVAMDGGDVSAVIPAGVLIADGVSSLALSVTLKDDSEANIQVGENEEMRPLDVHIEGVAEGNTVPMLVTLEHYLSTGINTGALKLYHVENGVTVAMTQVENPVNHNEFSYDPLTGDLTLALASFSEVAVVADTDNTWDGTAATAFAGGSGTEVDPYLIANASQLAYFRNEVDGGNSFEGKYVQLSNNITLSDVNFDPIGWGYVNASYNSGGAEGKVFKGTFDGSDNNYIIYGLYQSGWGLESTSGTDYTYTNCGFGLFAAASGATFKNLTIYGANITVECVEAGILVGLSQGDCSYNNISIQHSKIANYQRPAGGLIGEVSALNGGTTTITDVTIGADVVVGSLWGDFDTPCGGVIGMRWDDSDTTKVNMTNVKVHCQMDVYSDVTAAYRWYAYRRAGMLIGNTDQPAANGKTAQQAEAFFLTCTNVEVCYGDWANYHYCLFTNDNNPGKNYPWVRVEAGANNSAYSNPRYGHPTDADGNQVTNDSHTHQSGDACGMELWFNQLYGGGQGVYGKPDHEGVTVVDYKYSITYINDSEVLSVKYVTDNSEAVPTANPAAQDLVEQWGKENIEYDWTFGGWMTAASAVVTAVSAGNDTDIVLYPYYQGVHTATFVDQSGTILAWELFAEGATSLTNVPANPVLDGFEFDHWEIRHYYEDGTFDAYGELNETTLKAIKCDITLYPYYKYNGDVNLIPVDSDADGETNYYQVGGYGADTGEQELVEIPGYVNGIPVTTINADAFSSYDDLHSVRIPGTIEEINSQSFTADNPDEWGTQRDTITIYYEGDPAVWKEAMDLYNKDVYTGMLKEKWDNAMGDGSRVFFLVNGKVDNSKYWELNDEWTWDLHEHAYTYEAAKVCGLGEASHYEYGGGIFGYGDSLQEDEFTNYAGNCDCDSCNGATRPDAGYWTTE